MLTKSTTTEDLIASIYSMNGNNYIKMAAFNALETRCGREAAVAHWKLAGNGEASMPPSAPEPVWIRIGDGLKKSITAYIRASITGKDFAPDTWGRIELEGEGSDYKEIVVAGYCGDDLTQRKSFVVQTYETNREVRVSGLDEIVRRFREC